MSNKQLAMFEWAHEPVVGDDAPQSASGASPMRKPAARDLWERSIRWSKGRIGVALRRLLVVALVLLSLGLIAFGWLWQVTPSTADLMTQARAQVAAHHAPYTPLAAITPQMAHAVVAIEDDHFYQHHGIDTVGLGRAALNDLRAGHLVEGGSTITAQLAKLVYLQGYDHTFPRKAQDLVLALKIEQHHSKGQIMEMYLNVAYYGENTYGIGAAAQHYFGVTPAKLDLAQSALLAGLLQAPGAYDPWCHAALARSRQDAVLAHMTTAGYISPAAASAAATEVLPFWSSAPGQHGACVA